MTRIALVALGTLLCLTASAAAQAPTSRMDGDRFYLHAESLLWWTKDSPAPVPLVSDGALGAGTRVFLGGEAIDLGARAGARLTVGYWLTADRAWGVEAGGFFLPTATERRSVTGSGAPGSRDLVVPFFDPTLSGENFTNVSLAGAFSGSATEQLTSRVWGAEGNVIVGLTSQGPWRVGLLGGVRFLKVSERYSFETSSPDLPPGPTTVFLTHDVFDADNDFYGAQLGVRGRHQSGRWSADGTLKVSVGVMRQRVDVAGSLLTNQFTAPTVATFAGGYFAQPTNIGSHARDVVAVVPEIGLNVGYRLTDWAAIVVGYTFLYASNIVRPGHQIDRAVNPTQSPSFGGPIPSNLAGQPSPRFRFESSDFWAHGLSLGFGLRF